MEHMHRFFPSPRNLSKLFVCVCALLILAALVSGTCFALGDARVVRESVSGGHASISTDETVIKVPGGTITLRLYRPESSEALPVILYCHGGGWMYGNIKTGENLCRHFSAEVPALVVAVGYRLAPRHKFPVAAEDVYAALVWVYHNAESLGADRDRIALCGDSAGGNLAAVTCLMARDRNGPRIAAQVLAFPVTDLSSFDTESYRMFSRSRSLTRRQMAWFREHYLRGTADRNNPYASPLRAENLSGLPAALVITGEQDVLRDEGEAYAAKLRHHGCQAETLRLPGQAHATAYWWHASEVVRPAIDAAVAVFKNAFAKKT